MPFPNEHSARLAEPRKFVRLRRQNGRGGRGIDFVFGVRPADKPGPRGGRTVLQSIRFDAKMFAPAQAKKWLAQRKFQVLKFEPATRRGRRTLSGTSAPIGATTMPQQERLTPTPERPILAFQPTDREGRAVTPPIPLNPAQAMRLMGRLPDALTLAGLDYFQGIGGLGRMMMEVALEDVVAPKLTGAARAAAGSPVGAGPTAVSVVFDPLINPQQFPVEASEDVLPIAGGGGYAPQYGSAQVGQLGIAGLLFSLARAGLSRLLPFLFQTAAPAAAGAFGTELAERFGRSRGRRLFAGRGQLAGGFGGDIAVGLANAGATKLGRSLSDVLAEAARGIRKVSKGPTADSIAAIITSAKSIAGKLREGKGISAGEALDLAAKTAREVAQKRASGGKITAAEVLELVKKRTRDMDKLLGIDLAQQTLVAGETVSELAAVDAAALSAPAKGWRPHLGEYTAACLAHPRANRGSLDGLVRAAKLGMFDDSPESGRLAASGLLGVSELGGSDLSQDQLGEVAQLGLTISQVVRNARGFFGRLRARGIPRTLVNAAQSALSSLVRGRTNVNRITVRGKQNVSQQKQVAARLAALERRARTSTGSVAAVAALNRARRDLSRGLAMLRKGQRDLAQLLQREKKRVADAKAVAASTVKAAVAEAKKAEGADGARGSIAQALKENGFLRGQVMLLSKREFQQGVKDLAEARQAKKKLEAIARTLSQARKADAKKLRDLKLLIVKTKAKLREQTARANLVTRQTGIDEEVKRQREILLQRLSQLKDSFKGELFRIKNITDEAVQKAGDVVSKSGINLMFRFLQQMTQGMRDIRDVTDAGEFLRLFPQVLEQLKLAQEIAAPDKPIVNVTVPPQVPPAITIQPPSFRLSPQFEIKAPDVTIQEGDVTVQVVPGQTKTIPSGAVVAA